MQCLCAAAHYGKANDVVAAAEESRRALRAIARLTGYVDAEHVLDVIFARFCVGK